MKRKRGSKAGHKKGKKKTKAAVDSVASAPVSVNTEDVVCSDEADGSPHNSEMDIDQASLGSEKPGHMSNIDGDPPANVATGKPSHGRVKLKLKSSKALEPHQSYSDAQTPSDTDKSNAQVGLDKLDASTHKEEDNLHSDGQTSEMQKTAVGKSTKKKGSIKIKSSQGLGISSGTVHEKQINKISIPKIPGEQVLAHADDGKSRDALLPKNLRQRGTKELYMDSRYNEKELTASLMVIKKVMKMEAAVPFNAPVDPVALGIPDYFDIIDTPMDFGTISQNLENSRKYRNSEDVYKDVQYIWDNCCKYNNKGDYIVDLMKRVKKNFMKYWTDAGLYTDIPSSSPAETNPSESAGRPGQAKLHTKGKHKRRRLGRRRKERQEDLAVVDNQTATSDVSLSRNYKAEEKSPIDNLYSENASSSVDHSMETEANMDTEEAENEKINYLERPEPQQQGAVDNELELQQNASGSSEMSEQIPLENVIQDSDRQSQEPEPEFRQLDDLKDGALHQQEAGKLQPESAGRNRQIQLREEDLEENHSALQICRNLFLTDRKSVWNSPHSLFHRRAPVQDGLIHAAISTFLKH
ncbi:Bromodomain-containing protein [Dioscorea alata]|uniref:Bromodomain-containing protein n=3 Tax=Dioscorea alata TaxID=55571 RepID=A0ACB7WAZ0_DIOAL|nr:Bromodomain-containing protein [Dioscorea alata]KAH7685227.1 Bromodomain-containing protein [Dioscorea alata]KAH7685230.1 Bromodomain-containing protein [Dioscorea alata]